MLKSNIARVTLSEENKCGRNVKLKIVNWTFEIGEILELKIANRQSIAWIGELRNAKKHCWVENKELKIDKQHD